MGTCDLESNIRKHSSRAVLDESRSSTSISTTHLLTAIVVLTNVSGNILLSHGMQEVGSIVSASPFDYLRALLNPWVLGGSCTLAVWMISELALLSRADLTFVLPVTASAYVLTALAGHFFLGDQIPWQRWLGIVVISIGVFLAEETPSLTSVEPYRENRE